NGTYAWVTKAGGTGQDEAKDIAALSDGSSLITGKFGDKKADFGTISLPAPVGTSGNYDFYTAKLNADGSFAWVTRGGGPNNELANSISAFSDGSSISVGSFTSYSNAPAIFGTTSLEARSGGSYDIYIVKLNADGSYAWTTKGGYHSNDDIDVKALSDGSSLITGRYGNFGAWFGSTNFPSGGGAEAFIAKLNSDGSYAWATKAGGTSNDYGTGITVLSDGSPLITGYYAWSNPPSNIASFGGTTLTSAGGADVFVAKLNANGSWSSGALDAASTTYGSIAINATTGVWSYTLDNTLAATQALKEGQTVTQSYSARVTDDFGAYLDQSVTVTISGTNDVPVVTNGAAALAGTVVEAGNNDDGSVVAGTSSISGTLSASDVDSGATRTWSIAGTPSTTYGAIAIDASTGVWTYSLDNSKTATQALKEGQAVTQSFTARVTDDFNAYVDQTITVTINGTNDVPVVTSTEAARAGTVVEAGHNDNGTIFAGTSSISGTLSASDADSGATRTWSLTGTPSTTYGTIALNASTGVWSYTLDNTLSATQALKKGQTVTQSYNARVTDEFGASVDQSITVTISGSNDAPTLTAVSTLAGAIEDSFKEITFADLATAADAADIDSTNLGFQIAEVSSGELQKWNPTANAAVGAWEAVVAGSTLLAAGEKLQWKGAADANGSALNAFSVKVWDGAVASATAVQVTINVAAVNDAPRVVSVTQSGSVTEDLGLGMAGMRAQKERLTFSGSYELGDSLSLSINGIAINYTVVASDLSSSSAPRATIASRLAAAVSANASVNALVSVAANGDQLELTGRSNTAFTVTTSAINASGKQIVSTPIQPTSYQNTQQEYSNRYAFAALRNDGSVVTWGHSDLGGNSNAVASRLTSDVVQIFSGAGAFAALKTDGSVVTWGGLSSSSVAGSLTSGVKQ
ncbi:MAG: VCBS domain-containing protein, partial [Cyanobium sp. LacPavin_0920_WC12_MAG_62_9]|nr:VCBS domain-containing protein [Cyanobium sp. LacPavin_0920_WC12_MAG_62_9]